MENGQSDKEYLLSNEHDQSIHVRPYADMIEKMSYVQKADFAKAALEYERDAKTLKQMFEEVSRERNAWISEYRAARAEVERLKTERDKHLGRVNGLEEWLTEYRDQLKKENAFHKNTGIINAINELLNGGEYAWPFPREYYYWRTAGSIF